MYWQPARLSHPLQTKGYFFNLMHCFGVNLPQLRVQFFSGHFEQKRLQVDEHRFLTLHPRLFAHGTIIAVLLTNRFFLISFEIVVGSFPIFAAISLKFQ